MPPQQDHQPETDTDLLLEQGHKQGSGPVVAVIIIVVMLVLGALYFWGAKLNKDSQPLPLIPNEQTSQ
jgi:hypothetical protein